MRTLEVVAAVVGTAVLVSCSSAPEQAAPSATLSPVAVTEAPTPTPTPTEAPIDTAKVPDDPDDIDVEYVQAVMDDLDTALGEVYREVKATRKTGEAYQAGMRSVYSPQAATDLIAAFRRSIGVKGLAARPGNPETNVTEVLEATRTCVYFTANRDLNPLLREPLDPVQPYYLALGRTTPNDLNTTAWVLHMDTYFRDNSAPASVCEAGT